MKDKELREWFEYHVSKTHPHLRYCPYCKHDTLMVEKWVSRKADPKDSVLYNANCIVMRVDYCIVCGKSWQCHEETVCKEVKDED